MKIGITGDTHASVTAMRKILCAVPPVELWLHTGDHGDDANFLEGLTGIRTVRVRGNCDFMSHDLLDEYLELEGFKIWLTHGHKYIRGNVAQDLAYWARALEQDIVIFGHTHVPLCQYIENNLLINPGSPSRPRGGSKASFAVLTLKRGTTPSVEFFEL